jgi:hypothetical protein
VVSLGAVAGQAGGGLGEASLPLSSAMGQLVTGHGPAERQKGLPLQSMQTKGAFGVHAPPSERGVEDPSAVFCGQVICGHPLLQKPLPWHPAQ